MDLPFFVLPVIRGRIEEGAGYLLAARLFQIMSHDLIPVRACLLPSPSRPPPWTGEVDFKQDVVRGFPATAVKWCRRGAGRSRAWGCRGSCGLTPRRPFPSPPSHRDGPD